MEPNSIEARTPSDDKSVAALPAHTPGPWDVGSPTDVHHDYPQRYDTRSVNIVGPDKQTIATAYGGHIRPEWRAHVALDEVEANARLIAAAPDLLQALHEVVGAHAEAANCFFCEADTDRGEPHDRDCTMHFVLAAIERAKGVIIA